jgi:hypothetical protein
MARTSASGRCRTESGTSSITTRFSGASRSARRQLLGPLPSAASASYVQDALLGMFPVAHIYSPGLAWPWNTQVLAKCGRPPGCTIAECRGTALVLRLAGFQKMEWRPPARTSWRP